jgi:shikimate kinase
MKQNLILIGFMGSGKSTVGRAVAKTMDMNFIDIDQYIEQKEKLKIKDIFEKKGEKYFRQIEEKYIREISQVEDTVISTGGGVVSSPKNMELLRKNGYVVYLDCTIDCIEERVSRRNTRPMLNNAKNLRKRIEELLGERADKYEKYSDGKIKIDSNTNIWDTVEQIKTMYINFG